jgi:mannose-6-phosphate isomerase-like protein (cupin superfamily)
MIDLDNSLDPNGDTPATTRNLLARYLVIREGEEFELSAQATSVLFYVIKGNGRSFQEDEVIEWGAGDVFVFPGGESILNEAPGRDALLFVVTDEPFVSMTGCTVPSREGARCKSTHFVAKTIQSRFEDVEEKRKRQRAAADQERLKHEEDAAAHAETEVRAETGANEGTAMRDHVTGPENGAAGKAEQSRPAVPEEPAILVLASSGFESLGCVAPTFSAGIMMLVAGAQQQTHRHDADTISLSLRCDGVYSVIDGVRHDCKRHTATLTPAGVSHARHNAGESTAFSFFVQDRGPRPVRAWWPEQAA